MVFRCMIHNLFDEYQFFHNYPDKVPLIGSGCSGYTMSAEK